MGIPHSTQIRIRSFGGALLPSSRVNNDIACPPGNSMIGYTLDDATLFRVGFVGQAG